MLRPRIIPCLLVKNKGLVKTVNFKQPKYVGDPINAVKIFNEKEVDELMVLDIDATKRTLTQQVIPAVIGSRPTDSGRSQSMYDTAWDAIVAEWNEKTRGETAFDAVMAVQGYEQHRSVIRNNSRDVASIRRLLRDDFPLTGKAVSVFS